MQNGMYGLPQAGIIAQQLLEERLKKHGYRQSQTTPGLWIHGTGPISLSLVIGDFRVKYVGEENAQHLLDMVRQYYKCLCNWEGECYCGLTKKWDYKGQKVHLSMPGYLPKAQTHFKHYPKHTARPIVPPYQAQLWSQDATHGGGARDLSKRFAGHSCSMHEASAAASFRTQHPRITTGATNGKHNETMQIVFGLHGISGRGRPHLQRE